MPCSNAAKTQNPLKFVGVPQTPEPISGVSGPKFTILSGHVEEVLLLNKCFSDCRYMPYLRRYDPTKLCDGSEMAIVLRPVFAASRVQRISDLHSIRTKATPCAKVWYTSNLRLRLGEEKKKKKKKKKQDETRMWANAQPDGRPAKHRWRPLFNAAKFG